MSVWACLANYGDSGKTGAKKCYLDAQEIIFVYCCYTSVHHSSRLWIALTISIGVLNGIESCVVAFTANYNCDLGIIWSLHGDEMLDRLLN